MYMSIIITMMSYNYAKCYCLSSASVRYYSIVWERSVVKGTIIAGQ